MGDRTQPKDLRFLWRVTDVRGESGAALARDGNASGGRLELPGLKPWIETRSSNRAGAFSRVAVSVHRNARAHALAKVVASAKNRLRILKRGLPRVPRPISPNRGANWDCSTRGYDCSALRARPSRGWTSDPPEPVLTGWTQQHRNCSKARRFHRDTAPMEML